MVPLESRSEYNKTIKLNVKLSAFSDFLFNNKLITSSDEKYRINENIFIGMLNAITKDDSKSFVNLYNRICTRIPTSDTNVPFVNDDFLIFTIILGVVKFNCSRDWISNILSIRNINKFTLTFENLINDNYYSNKNLYGIVIVFLKFINFELITNDLVTKAYKSISANTELFECKSDFQILCTLCAYDFIIEIKTIPDKSEIFYLTEFNKIFVKRAKLLSGLLQFITLSGLLYYIGTVISNFPIISQTISNMNLLTGAMGISIMGNFIPWVRRYFFRFVLLLSGYPKALINRIILSDTK